MSTPLSPYDALRRIAYLLERSRAGTFRVKAFRAAAATALATGPGELASRAEAGTLTDLPGIGTATETVIRESLAGEIPEYLRALEDKAQQPLVAGGLEVRAALRGDLHSMLPPISAPGRQRWRPWWHSRESKRKPGC